MEPCQLWRAKRGGRHKSRDRPGKSPSATKAICFDGAPRPARLILYVQPGRLRQRMNKMERDLRPEGQAELEYLDGEYRVISPGSYVVCAVTGVHIPIEALRYWSVDLQEAYATATVAMKRFQETGKTPQ